MVFSWIPSCSDLPSIRDKEEREGRKYGAISCNSLGGTSLSDVWEKEMGAPSATIQEVRPMNQSDPEMGMAIQ